MIKILELFGGIGAPRKAMINLGVPHKSIDYVEWNEKAVRTYNAMYDNRYKAESVVGYDLRPDILVHGSPCQDFSIGGKQYGGNVEDGTRSSLMFETIRIIRSFGEWKPKFVIWENVPNVLSEKMRGAFDHYLGDMEKLGYTTNYRVLDAMDFGVPQKRKRIYAISCLNGSVFDFDKLEKKSLGNISDFLDKENYGKEHLVSQPSMIAKLPSAKNYSSYTRRLQVVEDYCWTITTKQMRCPNSGVVDLGNDRYRYLTELECWRLMGFDDSDFNLALKEHPGIKGKLNGTLYHQAGNSIVVQVLEAIFKLILSGNYDSEIKQEILF